MIFLEVLQAKKFTDVSASQWLALTPKQVVQDHLHMPESVWDNLPKEKTYIKPGNTNMTALADAPVAVAGGAAAASVAKPRAVLPEGGVEETKREVTFFA